MKNLFAFIAFSFLFFPSFIDTSLADSSIELDPTIQDGTMGSASAASRVCSGGTCVFEYVNSEGVLVSVKRTCKKPAGLMCAQNESCSCKCEDTGTTIVATNVCVP